jgi:hypothetical protein
VFSIQLQEEVVSEACDILREADGVRKTLVKEFQGIQPGKELTVSLTPTEGSLLEPILHGIEIIPQSE